MTLSEVTAEAVAALLHAEGTPVHFTCSEADALCRFVRSVAGDHAAAQWLHEHARGDDDETDRHSVDWTEAQTLAYAQAL